VSEADVRHLADHDESAAAQIVGRVLSTADGARLVGHAAPPLDFRVVPHDDGYARTVPVGRRRPAGKGAHAGKCLPGRRLSGHGNCQADVRHASGDERIREAATTPSVEREGKLMAQSAPETHDHG